MKRQGESLEGDGEGDEQKMGDKMIAINPVGEK